MVRALVRAALLALHLLPVAAASGDNTAGDADGEVAFLQIATKVAKEGKTALLNSFTDAAGLMCQEGPLRAVEASLAMKKASVLGALYNDSYVRPNSTCHDRGYAHAVGEESCHPGLNVSFRAAADQDAWAQREAEALVAYRAAYGLDHLQGDLMRACTCHPASREATEHAAECFLLSMTTPGSWIHRDPADGRMLVCDQGPFVYATRALAVVKSSPLLLMHQHDQISPRPCSHYGFGVMYHQTDHCYPEMHMWTRTQQPMQHCPPGGLGPDNPDCDDAGIVAVTNIEDGLTQEGGFKRFAGEKGLSPTFHSNPACNCRAESFVRMMVSNAEGDGFCRQPSKQSPVRDIWSD